MPGISSPHWGVNADASPGFGDGCLERLGHAVEHRNSVGMRGKPGSLRRRFGISEATKIMSAERGANEVNMVNQRAGKPFIVGIGIGFRFEIQEWPNRVAERELSLQSQRPL